jgi:hypothetical protein
MRTCGLGLVASVLAGPVTADAQAARVPAWDTAVMTGVFVARPRLAADIVGHYDDWYHTGTLAVSAGRYLTRHLKVEGEAMMSGEGRRFVQRFVAVPGLPGVTHPVGSEEKLRTNGISAGLAWQFLDNQWAHPFVFGGVAVDFDRTRVETWPQSYYRGDPRIPGNEIPLTTHRVEDHGTSSRVRAVIGTGAKLYMTPRSFFKTGARVSVGESSGHVSFRLGFGFDF